jgi:hypothetical protein
LTSQHTAIQYLGFPFLFLKIFRWNTHIKP